MNLLLVLTGGVNHNPNSDYLNTSMELSNLDGAESLDEFNENKLKLNLLFNCLRTLGHKSSS